MTLTELKKGMCHCKAVEFQVMLSDGLKDLRRCNCSLCSRRGAIMASAPLASLKVVKGEENLSLYQWNSKTAKHFFCKICGIYTHHQRRSDPTQFGFNIACLEGVNPFDFEDQLFIGKGAGQTLVHQDK